jgi:TPR repeat protein
MQIATQQNQKKNNGTKSSKKYSQTVACGTALSMEIRSLQSLCCKMHTTGEKMKLFIYVIVFLTTLTAETNLEQECQNNNADTCNTLGVKYGKEGKYVEAMKYYDKACKLKIGIACSNMGFMYMNAQGVKRNFMKAKTYTQKGCELKSAFSCINLGVIYQYGYGVEKDLKQALKAYDKSCQYGGALGCNEAGVVAHILKDEEKSLTYYMYGCHGDEEHSCYNAGYAFDMVQGTKKDKKLAYEYWDKACLMGWKPACEALRR